MPLFDPDFLFVLIAMGLGALLIRNRLRERQGQPPLDQDDLPAMARLGAENAALRERLAHLEDRLRVLERIVTDSSHDTARRIEALRDHPDGA